MTSTLPAHIFHQKTPNAGTCLFTSKEISAGELIFRLERPLVSVLDSVRLRDTCEACLQWMPESAPGDEEIGNREDERKILKDCLGCKVVRYCSKVCFFAFTFVGSRMLLAWIGGVESVFACVNFDIYQLCCLAICSY